MKLSELLSAAEAEGILPSETRAFSETAAARPDPDSMPWYLHAFITVGAWISSAFFVLFIGALFGDFLLTREPGSVAVGLVGIAVATIVARATRNVFLDQVCLSVSVAGHVLVFLGISGLSRGGSLGLTVAIALLLAAGLYFAYPKPLHRFLSVATALMLWDVWLRGVFRPSGFWGARHVYSLLLEANLWAHLALILVAFLLPWRPRLSLRPLGYAAAVSLVVALLIRSGAGSYLGYASFAVATAALAIVAGGRKEIQAHPRLWGVVAAALLAIAYTSGLATLVALFLLVLGFRLQDRALEALGIILAPAFTFFHYYNLETTLLVKSVHLMVSGLIVLLLWLYLSRNRWRREAIA